MTGAEIPFSDEPARVQLERAVRDLWTMLRESGDTFVVFTDRRRLLTRVEQVESGRFRVSWEPEQESGSWLVHEGDFENPREAAFRGYQGPH